MDIQLQKARNAIFDAIETVQDNVPDGREKALAITKLQEALLWVSYESVLRKP